MTIAMQEKDETHDWAVLLPLALPPDLPPVIVMDFFRAKIEGWRLFLEFSR